jgi:Ca2+-binding EF-hand superfamily protein
MIPMAAGGQAVTEIEAFSRFDVNRDGKVDLADVAAAAYFFNKRAGDTGWDVPEQFDSAASPSGKVEVSPVRCDVNRDGVVDIEDLIQILANI